MTIYNNDYKNRWLIKKMLKYGVAV